MYATNGWRETFNTSRNGMVMTLLTQVLSLTQDIINNIFDMNCSEYGKNQIYFKRRVLTYIECDILMIQYIDCHLIALMTMPIFTYI